MIREDDNSDQESSAHGQYTLSIYFSQYLPDCGLRYDFTALHDENTDATNNARLSAKAGLQGKGDTLPSATDSDSSMDSSKDSEDESDDEGLVPKGSQTLWKQMQQSVCLYLRIFPNNHH